MYEALVRRLRWIEHSVLIQLDRWPMFCCIIREMHHILFRHALLLANVSRPVTTVRQTAAGLFRCSGMGRNEIM